MGISKASVPLGLDRMPAVHPAKLSELDHLFRDLALEEGLPACSYAVGLDGRIVASGAVADDSEAEPRFLVFSISKALVAGAIWLLISDGLLRPETPVADLIPQFAQNGKGAVTVEHLLAHSAGLARAALGFPEWLDRQQRVDAFARWELEWEPGTAFAYHGLSASWVLGEVIQRLSGMEWSRFIRECLLDPLGLPARSLALGLPEEEQEGILLPVRIGQGDYFEGPEQQELLGGLCDARSIALGVPGGGGVGTAAGLALYYQALLHNPDRLWHPSVLSEGTSHILNPHPTEGGFAANRTLGLVVAGDDGNTWRRESFGDAVSPAAFGHGGGGGQIAWADPASGLSFAFLTNGINRNLKVLVARCRALSTCAAG